MFFSCSIVVHLWFLRRKGSDKQLFCFSHCRFSMAYSDGCRTLLDFVFSLMKELSDVIEGLTIQSTVRASSYDKKKNEVEFFFFNWFLSRFHQKWKRCKVLDTRSKNRFFSSIQCLHWLETCQNIETKLSDALFNRSEDNDTSFIWSVTLSTDNIHYPHFLLNFNDLDDKWVKLNRRLYSIWMRSLPIGIL